MLRRVLPALALLALLVVSIEPGMLQILFIDREPSARALSEAPDSPLPLYPRFLEGVRAHTQPGDTIAIVIPRMSWNNGYVYAYYRASYFLAGREVLPLVTPENEKVPENFRAARYIAAFRVNVRMPSEVVWRGERGTLLRPIRGAPPAGGKAAAIHPESQR
ncbi:MAG TPA: hypothetical protein VHX14_10380 [Thermoanaerobaculia bacterium]|jgi:hypothetical protein|nr:hypothetical protein [Thermoanaerobaculia bacterium]